jgi:hypothetical protein
MATFGTFTAGQVLTAAELNSAGEWQTYTPTWTQSATITKTVNWARYTQLNKLVIVSLKMTATSAGTANNKVLVGLPVTASANNFVLGGAFVVDESATPDSLTGFLSVLESTTTASFFPLTTSGFDTTLKYGNTGLGNPVTIASGDILYAQFTYEAA